MAYSFISSDQPSEEFKRWHNNPWHDKHIISNTYTPSYQQIHILTFIQSSVTGMMQDGETAACQQRLATDVCVCLQVCIYCCTWARWLKAPGLRCNIVLHTVHTLTTHNSCKNKVIQKHRHPHKHTTFCFLLCLAECRNYKIFTLQWCLGLYTEKKKITDIKTSEFNIRISYQLFRLQ